MRTIKYLSFLILFSILLSSCSKEDNAVAGDTADDVATLTFGAVLNDMMKKSALKQAEDLPECSEDDPAYAEVSLTYGDTEIDVEVEILLDENGYFTAYHDDLEIPVTSGNTVNLTLTDFRVYDGDGDLIWLAPEDDSDYENFVADALPMPIVLRAGTKNYVDVEVLCFDDRVVNRYGYQFFDLLPETAYELCIFANYCTDAGRHYTADYNLDLYYYRGDDEEGEPILDDLFMNESPAQQGTIGNWYTDPLCVAVPTPQMGEDADDPYLYYEVTLEEWDDNYDYPGALVQTGYLSWNDIAGYLDTDNDNEIDDNSDVDYLHLQINCGEVTTPPTEECDIEGPDNDCNEVYLNGQDEWIEISEAGDLYLIVENTESVYGDVNVNLVDGDPVFTFYSQEGYVLDDYVIEISQFGDETEGLLACVSAEDITLEEGDADAQVDFTSDLTYPFYARIKANVCEIDNGEEPLELPDLAAGCEHAFLLEMEDSDGFYTAVDWGWAEYISAEDAGSPLIYSLTTVDGEDIGDVDIEVDGDDLTVRVNPLLAANVYIENLNIEVSATEPGAALPEDYDYNFNVNDTGFNEVIGNIPTDGEGGFWIIVHAELCPQES